MHIVFVILSISFTCFLCSKRFANWLEKYLAAVEAGEAPRLRDILFGVSQSLKASLRLSQGTRSKQSAKTGWHWIGLPAALGVVLLLTLGGSLYYVHQNIIPIPMAASIFNAIEVDQEQWEYNIEKGALGDLGADHEAWAMQRGHGFEHSRYWQEDLWEHWHSYIHGAILLVLLCISGIIALGFLLANRRSETAGETRPEAAPRHSSAGKKRRRKKRSRPVRVEILSNTKLPNSVHQSGQNKGS